VIEEVDGVDAVWGPGCLALQEGLESGEVDIFGEANEDLPSILVFFAFLGNTALLLVEIDCNTRLGTLKLDG